MSQAAGFVVLPPGDVYFSGVLDISTSMVGQGMKKTRLIPMTNESYFKFNGSDIVVAHFTISSSLQAVDRNYGFLSFDNVNTPMANIKVFNVGLSAINDGRNLVLMKGWDTSPITDIVISGIDVSSGRMGVEIIGTNVSNVEICHSRFEVTGGVNHGMGISLSCLSSSSFHVHDNTYVNCPYSAIELVGSLNGVHIHDEVFYEGNERAVRSSNIWNQDDIYIHDVSDMSGGSFDLWACDNAIVRDVTTNGYFDIRSDGVQLSNLSVTSSANYAIIFDNSGQCSVVSSDLSTEPSLVNFAVVRFYGEDSYGNTVDADLTKGFGGSLWDQVNGAANNLVL